MRKLLSILFASLILFSNMGFTISSHYCRGHLVKTELLHGTTSSGCCMSKAVERTSAACKKENSLQNPTKNCCENAFQFLNLDEDFCDSHSPSYIEGQKQLFAASTTFFTFQKSIPNTLFSSFPNYSPPPLIHDHYVLYQVFLL